MFWTSRFSECVERKLDTVNIINLRRGMSYPSILEIIVKTLGELGNFLVMLNIITLSGKNIFGVLFI